MTSLINPTNIDITYPIAGQDNDTQGFRTNFTNIKNNLTQAASEITALQANVATLQTGVFATVVQLASLTQSQVSSIVSPGNGMLVYNTTYGNVQAYTSHLGRWGNVVIS